jgi:2-polyprenyl-3-methyl-5-hydroxy-6-metoxy-1,4-benzoquinol methylase
MSEFVQLTQAQIRAALRAEDGEGISAHTRDEMAIPSYLHANPLIRWLMWKRYRVVSQMASTLAHDTVLEFGCGMGLFLPTLARMARTVYAIDLFPQFARQLAREFKLPVTFVDQVEAIPAGTLDLIVAADVLEHIADVEGYMRLFRGKLAPGGHLIVSGPTENFVYKIGRVVAGFAGKGDYHLTNINHLVARIEGSGFRARRERRLPFPFPPHLFRIIDFQAEE